MVDIFKDNHFEDQVKLHALPDSLKGHTTALASLFNISSREEFFLLGGHNINSLNFKCGDLYLKLIQNTLPKRNKVLKFPEIVKIMVKHGVPTSHFIPSKNGLLIEEVVIGGVSYLAYAQPFCGTTFFCGKKSEFNQIVSIIKALKGANQELKTLLGEGPAEVFYDSFDEKIPKLLVKVKNETNKKEFDHFIEENIPTIENALKNYSRNKEELKKLSIFHFDLHPHNIISDGTNIKSVIDLDSFHLMPEKVFEGFSFFKLARKCIAKGEISPEEVQASLPNSHELGEFSQIEMLRRIHLILQLHYNENNYEWDGEIKKQINGLIESSYIFS